MRAARLCRTSLYYTASEETAENLEIMRLLDRQYAITPFYGQRRLQAWLAEKGHPEIVNSDQGSQFTSADYVELLEGDELWRGLDRYFRFYNNERPHQSLGYKTLASRYLHQKEAA